MQLERKSVPYSKETQSPLNMLPDRNNLIVNPSFSQIRLVRRKIRKQVIMELLPELEQAAGWRRYWVKWKLNAITEIRYRGILCMGAAGYFPAG